MDLNRDHWDEATAIHACGNVYGLEDFKAGQTLGSMQGPRYTSLAKRWSAKRRFGPLRLSPGDVRGARPDDSWRALCVSHGVERPIGPG